jgi:hypothetical protein
MGPRIPLRRKLVRKNEKNREPGNRSDPANAVGPGKDADPALLARGASSHRKAPAAGVTHRSPSPDDMVLPCCGLPLPAVTDRDRLTTDPALVTCRG